MVRTRGAVAWEWVVEGGLGGKVMVGRNGRGEQGGAGLSGVEVGEKAHQDGS